MGINLQGEKHIRTIGDQFQAVKGYTYRFAIAAPLAANATRLLNAHAADGSTQSAAAQPDVPRTLQYVSSGSDTSHTVTVTGLDIRGNAISETITLNGTTPVHGTKAFASINANGIALPTVGANNISVGIDTGLGLPRCMAENSIDCETVDGAQEAIGSVVVGFDPANVSGNYVKPVTAPNGTHNYTIWANTTELTTAV